MRGLRQTCLRHTAALVLNVAVVGSLAPGLLPRAMAQLTAEQSALLDEGFRLFTTETFAGNGRTCGTCHIPASHYTISPAEIATMSAAQKALVLASNVPTLENPTLVEQLALFNINEDHAPGNTNTPLGPFRASMTVAGLAFTTANQFCTVPEGDLATATQCGSFSVTPTERANETINDGTRPIELGWAGDGGAGLDPAIFPNLPASAGCIAAIGDFRADATDLTKALRAFSLSAIRTHDTLTLDRIPGVDFRCPTAHELDALAAFQEWLGRRIELNLTQLTFVKGSGEMAPGPGAAEEGKAIFMSDLATCNRCHFNAGANGSLGRVLQPDFPGDDPNPPPPAPSVPGANKNSHTGTDLLRIAEVSLDASVNPIVIPRDPGDKRERGGVQADGLRSGGFNMQSLIEAPRKTSFFHNDGFSGSVEDAALFYFTPTFDASQGGSGRVAQIRYCAVPGNTCPNTPAKRLSGTDALAALGGPPAIDKLGFFLRALSAVYSLADCERLVDEMVQQTKLGVPITRPLLHCHFSLDDARNVLNGATVSPMPYAHVVAQLDEVDHTLTQLADAAPGERLNLLQRTDNRLRRLRNAIATTPELVAAPSIAGAPLLGIRAAASLVIALFAVAVVALRRRGQRPS